jgi:Mrp family chromosome partitioning ATPase
MQMGKLYEAVNRTRKQQLGDSIAAGSQAPSRHEMPEHFDFIRYSLGARPMLEVERASQETAAASMMRRSMTHPVTEVNLDLRKVDPHLVAFHQNRGGNEQCNKLAISLISKAAERSIKRVLIASANHGEGRTSVALNLACALARARQRVLIVDCDLTNPSVLRLLGATCEVGLQEALSRGLRAGSALVRVMPYGFNVLPVLRPVENPVEILAEPDFWKMLQMFDTDYDFVLFDSSPLLDAGDPSLLLRYTDTTMLVVRPGATSSAEMARAIVPFTQDDLFGVVINRAPEQSAK